MNIKMKVVTMQFSNKQNQQIWSSQNTPKECKIKQTASKWLQLLKDDSIYRIQNARQFISEQNIDFFIKSTEDFIKNFKLEKQQKKVKQTIDNEKALRENIEKISKKLGQSFYLINHLKQKVEKKQSQLLKKDQIIIGLKKQCFQWKQKIRKEFIVKELSETSNSLLNSLQLTSQSYQKPLEAPVNIDLSQKKDNFFYRTSSYELNHNKSTIILQDIGNKRHNSKLNQVNSQNKTPLKLSKREYSKTFDKLKSQMLNRENDLLTNGLMVTQKQISPHKERKCNKQN